MLHWAWLAAMGKELLVPWLSERSLISWFISSLAKHFSVHSVDLEWWLWGSALQCAAQSGEKPGYWWSDNYWIKESTELYGFCTLNEGFLLKIMPSLQTKPLDSNLFIVSHYFLNKFLAIMNSFEEINLLLFPSNTTPMKWSVEYETFVHQYLLW